MSRGGPRHRSRQRRPQEVTKQEESLANGNGPTAAGAPTAPAPLPPGVALERLRDRVSEAALELQRLREENAALAARLAEMEEALRGTADPSLLKLDETPEALREKIEGFIEAIDEYLAHE